MARGSIVKKPNGRYYIVYYLGKKQKWEGIGEPNTKKRAEKILAQRVAEIDRGEYREIKKTTFAEFAERWLRDYVDDPNFVKPSTAALYRNILETRLLPQFGNLGLGDVTPESIQEFIAIHGRAGRSPNTIQNYLVPLRSMLKRAVQMGYLVASPMPHVEKPRARRREMDFLTVDQIRAFLEHVPERWYAFFLTLSLTGMRVGEVMAMRWTNLDFERQCYQVRERLYRGLFDTPKTESSQRWVDLTSVVVQALRAHRVAQNETRLQTGDAYEDRDLVFCGDTGGAFPGTDAIRRAFRKALAAAGCPVIRLHDLRHSYASMLIDQGEHPKYIQKQLGHSSVQVTMDVYGHLMPDAGRRAARRIDERLFGGA